MNTLPTADLRTNLGTWAVPAQWLPAVAHFLHDVLPNEAYDPHFLGQGLATTYFDTAGRALRKARQKSDQYLTLRLRRYEPPSGPVVYALSAKTEAEKFRVAVAAALAEGALNGDGLTQLCGSLPADLQARLLDLAGDEPLLPVVTVRCRRYAVEDADDRFTLDVDVHTDIGKCLPYAVLEFKSTRNDALIPQALEQVQLRPIKLSKFLWSTCP